MGQIKITKTDSLFSNFIRDRDNWTCQRCGKHYDKSNTSDRQGLHCSHYYSRGKKSVRFEPDNCVALCYGCHKLWGHGDERDKYEDFMRRKLGQTRWASLKIQAFTYHAKDDKMDQLIVKMLVEDYEKDPDSYRHRLPGGKQRRGGVLPNASAFRRFPG